MSRRDLIRRGALGGALVAAGGALAVGTSAAAVPDGDLTYVRLLLATELLKADFESRALRSGKPAAREAALLRRMRAADRAHYAGLAAVLHGAGQLPATAGDIDFSYPRGTFATSGAILRRAAALASLALGGYLGALERVQTAELRLPLGQIAANEAQQVGALAGPLGRSPVGGAFARALPIARVSAALDEYES
jgi:hypothetical protein